MNKHFYFHHLLCRQTTSAMPATGTLPGKAASFHQYGCTALGLLCLLLQQLSPLQAQPTSQSPGVGRQWDKTFGGDKPDYLSAMTVTSDGGYMLSGYSASGLSGDRTQGSRGGFDYWIVKTDQKGVKQWDKRFGGQQDDILSSVVQSADGSYLLGGYTASGTGGDKTQDSRGGLDYWIVKTDNAGNKLWDKRFGGSETDILRHVINTPDNGYLLAGNSFSPVSGDKSQASRGVEDYWIVKIDSNGNKQWDRRYGGDNAELLSSVTAIGQEGFLLAGTSFSGISGDKSQASRGGWDYWLLKIDNNGNKIWDKRFGGSRSDFPAQVLQTRDGHYLLAGISDSGISGDKSEDSRGGWDYWVVKTDSNGNKLWDRRFGGELNDDLNVLLESKDGNYILGGSSDSDTGADKTAAHLGNNDYWLVKITKDGAKLWDIAFGGTDDDQLFGIAQTTAGHYLLAGHSSSGKSADKTRASKGSYDYWLVKTTADALLPAMLQVNFANRATPAPQGWVSDYGLPFGRKAQTGNEEPWRYGWKRTSDGTPVDLSVGGPFPGNGRWRPAPADTLLATLMHMQGNDVRFFKGTPVESYWEVAVENGVYQVTVSAGDGSVWFLNDEFHSINVEGVRAIDRFLPTGPAGSLTRFKQATVRVTVSDGLLTLDADGGTNTKINYAIIQPLGEAALAVAPENLQEPLAQQTGVYPNPFRDAFTLKTTYSGKVTVGLYDTMGNSYYTATHEPDNGELSLDVANLVLPAGIYFVKVQSAEEGSRVYRVIKR